MNRAKKRRIKKPANKDTNKAKPIQASSSLPEDQERLLAIQQAIDLGIKHHQAGDLPKAESI